MKWMTLFVLSFLLTGCYTNEVIEYPQVVVAPMPYEGVTYTETLPLNVTTTRVTYSWY